MHSSSRFLRAASFASFCAARNAFCDAFACFLSSRDLSCSPDSADTLITLSTLLLESEVSSELIEKARSRERSCCLLNARSKALSLFSTDCGSVGDLLAPGASKPVFGGLKGEFEPAVNLTHSLRRAMKLFSMNWGVNCAWVILRCPFAPARPSKCPTPTLEWAIATRFLMRRFFTTAALCTLVLSPDPSG